MTRDQYIALQRLYRCRFLPGGYDKRFVYDLSTYKPTQVLSRKQAEFLNKTIQRYRKQLANIPAPVNVPEVEWTAAYLEPELPQEPLVGELLPVASVEMFPPVQMRFDDAPIQLRLF